MLRSRRTKITLAVFFVLAIAFVGTKLLQRSNGNIEDFSKARLQGALIAQQIVDLSNQSAQDLEKINQLDREKNFTEALNITNDLIKRSQQIRDLAVQLSQELERMTRALSDINSFEARQAALESISSRLALITRLVSYSNYLSQLLETLRDRFSGTTSGDQRVSQLVDQINAEVRAINNFNNEASRAMERFDKIVN